jgi:exodeoxyribonuclease VII small subunit
MLTPMNPEDKRWLAPVDELPYEEAFRQLEELVAVLEANQQNLDKAVALFERGQALAQRCALLLDQAELRVRQLTENGLADLPQDS